MSMPFSWAHLIGIKPTTLIHDEQFLLEAELFSRICSELKSHFKTKQQAYFRLLKLTNKEEDNMLNLRFVPLIIQDILSTGEYTFKGIANYAETFEEALEEIMIGRNTNPSVAILWRLIELHRSVRWDLYKNIIQKIMHHYTKIK